MSWPGVNLRAGKMRRAGERCRAAFWIRKVIVALCLAGSIGTGDGRAETRETPGGFAPGTVIYPQGTAGARSESVPTVSSGSRTWLLVAAVVLAAGGVWVLYRRRAVDGLRGSGRSLLVEETRSLGNRQYLVIASCEGRRFLLGVTPGRIALVAPLDERKREDAT